MFAARRSAAHEQQTFRGLAQNSEELDLIITSEILPAAFECRHKPQAPRPRATSIVLCTPIANKSAEIIPTIGIAKQRLWHN
jgi:hypothetical protein